MIRLLFYIAICVIVFYAYRAFKRQSAHAARRMRRNEKQMRRARACSTLVRDPQTGEYRVEQD